MVEAVTLEAASVDLSTLTADPRNSRTHSDDQLAYIDRLMGEYGWTAPMLVDMGNGRQIVAGHGRKLAALRRYERGDTIHLPPGPPRGDQPGGAQLPAGHGLVIDCTGWSEAMRAAYVIADNRSAELAGWDFDTLRGELERLQGLDFDLSLTGFPDLASLDDLMANLPGGKNSRPPVDLGKLAESFGVPPFTVLNGRDGWWRDRKRAWLARGIQSELGRGDAAGSTPAPVGEGGLADQVGGGRRKGRVGAATSYQSQDSLNAIMGQRRGLGATPTDLGKTGGDAGLTTGTSVFDPVLTELAYRWFCPPGGLVLDPFAGGSVRGLVAAWLGRSYLGMDLSGRQLVANREQAARLLGDERQPVWVQGDSRQLDAGLQAAGHDDMADFIFTCPPYADLEVYSDDPADLSNMPYEQFLQGYRAALAQAAARLRNDRFAVIVVGEVRDDQGHYRNFVGDTVEAMRDAGLEFYNEAIFVTPVGSLPVRAGKQFLATRKLGKTHQNVLVFVKGDDRKATKAVGPVDFGQVAAEQEDDGAPPDPEPRPAQTDQPVPLPPADLDPMAPTPVSDFGGWWAKREDWAGFHGSDYPTGAKVRQFLKMAAAQPDVPLIVGCSADSAMQVYVAACAKLLDRRGIVYVPGRSNPTGSTRYAKAMGAEVNEVRPGYLSVCRARARERAKAEGGAVRWTPQLATADTMEQVGNLPAEARRVVVPVGTGAICAGILAGLAEAGRTDLVVLAVAVSDMTDRDKVLANAAKATSKPLPELEWVRSPMKYEQAVHASLPDQTPLDPFYAAKCLHYVRPGDVLWTSGLRPQGAFPG